MAVRYAYRLTHPTQLPGCTIDKCAILALLLATGQNLMEISR